MFDDSTVVNTLTQHFTHCMCVCVQQTHHADNRITRSTPAVLINLHTEDYADFDQQNIVLLLHKKMFNSILCQNKAKENIHKSLHKSRTKLWWIYNRFRVSHVIIHEINLQQPRAHTHATEQWGKTTGHKCSVCMCACVHVCVFMLCSDAKQNTRRRIKISSCYSTHTHTHCCTLQNIIKITKCECIEKLRTILNKSREYK
jgi:hypothetical protein